MHCSKCGTEHPEDARFCKSCGADLSVPAPPPPPAPQPAVPAPVVPDAEVPRTSGLAIASLVLGLLGPVTGIVGIILGIVALTQIRESRGRLRGDGLAIAGMAISGFMVFFVGILLAILFPVFGRAREKARESSCLSNIKQQVIAVCMYCADYDGRMPRVNIDVDSYLMPSGGINTSGIMPWLISITPYMMNTQLLNCPSVSLAWDGGVADSSGEHCYDAISYGYNSNCRGRRESEFYFIGETCCIAEKGDTETYYLDADGTSNGRDDMAVERHNHGCNAAFADGHAKWRQASNIPRDAYDGYDNSTMSRFWDPTYQGTNP